MSSSALTNTARMIFSDFAKYLEHNQYTTTKKKDRSGLDEYLADPLQDTNPAFHLYQDQKVKSLFIEVHGMPWNYMVEMSLRYLKLLSVSVKSIDVYSVPEDELLTQVESITNPNPLFTIQQRLFDKNMSGRDVRMVIQLSAVRKPSQASSTPSTPRRKPMVGRPRIPIRAPVGPSPVMHKRRKLSQLVRREVQEPEPTLVAAAPAPQETEEEIDLPILDNLTEDEQTILREILKRPKKKVQSNHIAKKTNLDQDLIRENLRSLVNKGILRVSSGWYVLKKPPKSGEEDEDDDGDVEEDKKVTRVNDQEEEDEDEESTSKSSRRRKRKKK